MEQEKRRHNIGVSIMIDGAMFIAGVIFAVQMHGDIKNLKEQSISDGRIVRIEEQLRETRDIVKEIRDTQRRNTQRRESGD